ncbi:uncharacterized protein [Clytia hemisphaerica]|uniref:Sugar phosphate transporter domain-containing protein n=1 Tax=Clytia hemisphaerica TaxID=252671 RepID=A0A7M5VAK9_9CNID
MSKRKTLLSWLQSFAPGFLAALFYGLVSGSMSFLNKVVLTTFKFHYPDIVMLAQVVMTSIVVELCRVTKMCDIPQWTWQRGKEFLIPSLCFALHTTLALAALAELSIPIYNVLRRMLPLASLLMARYVLKKTLSRKTYVAIAFTVVGTLMAGFGDLQFKLYGYVDAILSVMAQSFYLTYVQKTGIEKGASALSVLHLNSINCILPLMMYTLWNGSLLQAARFEGFKDSSFNMSFMINVSMGCVLNYSLFLCATMNSALTTSVVGVVKGVITSIIGFFTFGGVPPSALTLGGVSMNALGGALYTFAKYREKQILLQKAKTELPL